MRTAFISPNPMAKYTTKMTAMYTAPNPNTLARTWRSVKRKASKSRMTAKAQGLTLSTRALTITAGSSATRLAVASELTGMTRGAISTWSNACSSGVSMGKVAG